MKLTFRNGSVFDVVSPLNSTRGGRRNAGILDEYRDHDADDLNEIVLPLLNVTRKMKNGVENPKEPHQVQIWISSASDKNTYCYDKTIEMPKQYFIMFNRLKKEVTEPRYALYFLYNSRNQIENINRRFSLGKEKTRMYKVWEYVKNNYYILLPEYYKKSEGIIHTYENQNTKGNTPRRKNKLLEE